MYILYNSPEKMGSVLLNFFGTLKYNFAVPDSGQYIIFW